METEKQRTADVRLSDQLAPTHEAEMQKAHERVQRSLSNPAHQVYFRAGLIACREYMARFVEAESPTIAASVRANWWPELGPDLGAPRLIEWGEVTEGEYGEEGFRCKEHHEISPTLEALAIAAQFLQFSPDADVGR